jgi:hypothetical protein
MATSIDGLNVRLRRWGTGILVAIAVLICLPLALPIVAGYGLYAFSLHVLIWLRWGPAGTRVLFVYSNSPVWQSYIENNIVPRLPPGSVVLNWSERRHWPRWSLPVRVFRFFGGRREFNPLAVVVEPLCWGRTFRFWKAFRDAKHGNHEALRRVEAEFFKYLESSRDAEQPGG